MAAVHSTTQTRISIIVAGGGIGGLCAAYLLGRAGHTVTVFEAAPVFEEVGAGIQLTPNVTRLLIRWGLGDKLKDRAVIPEELDLRRYDTGELLGWMKWGDIMKKDHGSPYYHIHRADLHQMILDLALPYITLRTGTKVTDVDSSTASVTLESGEKIKADLVIGADGVKSRLREIVVGGPDKAKSTGDAAYRALIPTEEMMKDPGLKQLVDGAGVTVWMGPHRHIVGYCIRGKKLYNVVMLHPSREDNEEVRPESCEVMREDYQEFEPRVVKLLKLVPSTLVWSLKDRDPLDSWTKGKLTLLGDACHPMLPYRAQGAAMAIEDAAVLGYLFTKLTCRSQIPALLSAYEQVRKPRATEAQLASRTNQQIFHFPDGPEQEARDAVMRQGTEGGLKELRGEKTEEWEEQYSRWTDRFRNRASFSYDVELEAAKWWVRNLDRFSEQKAKL